VESENFENIICTSAAFSTNWCLQAQPRLSSASHRLAASDANCCAGLLPLE
jgi:hypothetical protein